MKKQAIGQKMGLLLAEIHDAESSGSVLEALNIRQMMEMVGKLEVVYGMEDEAEELEIGE